MRKVLILLFAQLAAAPLPKSKTLFMQDNGSPIVLLNGGTFDMTASATHPELLTDSVTVIRRGR